MTTTATTRASTGVERFVVFFHVPGSPGEAEARYFCLTIRRNPADSEFPQKRPSSDKRCSYKGTAPDCVIGPQGIFQKGLTHARVRIKSAHMNEIRKQTALKLGAPSALVAIRGGRP